MTTTYEAKRTTEALGLLQDAWNRLEAVTQTQRRDKNWTNHGTTSMYQDTLAELIHGSLSDDEDHGLLGWARQLEREAQLDAADKVSAEKSRENWEALSESEKNDERRKVARRGRKNWSN